MENICLFMPKVKKELSIQIINFVLENNMELYKDEIISSVYKLHIVKEGSGILHTPMHDYSIKKGDIFITIPSFRFSVKAQNDLSFMYISFMGRKGNMMLDKIGVSSTRFIFTGYENLLEYWIESIMVNSEIIDWMAESVLLYTFSRIVQNDSLCDSTNKLTDIIDKCKNYIDINFYDYKLSLNKLSEVFFYNPKYISFEFKRQVGIGINEYIKKVRIQHATSLFNSGINSVSEVATSCGFSDAQYFSKVFKGVTGITPIEFRR